ncbi:MAG: hypothetical protein QGG40_17545 [Myxococcota bacterium]|jgi:hypothetical protein|nr:hypothetical protein [Myxococcota bacterium]
MPVLFALLLPATVLQGCSVRGNVGRVASQQHDALAVDVYADYLLVGAGIRTRLGEDIQEAGLALEVGYSGRLQGVDFLPVGSPLDNMGVFGHIGVTPLYVGLLDEQLRWGAVSPWIEAGLGWCWETPDTRWCAYVAGDAERSRRFAPFEPEAFVGMKGGLMYVPGDTHSPLTR